MSVSKFSQVLLDTKSPAVAAASTPVFEMKACPDDVLVLALVMELVGTFTVSGSPAWTPAQMSAYVTSVDMQSDFLQVHSTGYGLWCNAWQRLGKTVMNKSRAAAGTFNTYIPIPLHDRRSKTPLVGTIPGAFLRDRTIQYGVSATTVYGTTTTLTAMTMRLFALTIPGLPGFVPAKSLITYQDWQTQTADLPPGLLQDIFIYAESQATFTLAQVAQLTLTMDGLPVLMNTYTDFAVYMFNFFTVQGGSEDNSSEQIQDDAMPFVPVYSPPLRYDLAQLHGSEKAIQSQITGTLTTPRYHVQGFVDAKATQESPAVHAQVKKAHPNHAFSNKLLTGAKAHSANKQALLNTVGPKMYKIGV